MAVLHTIPGNEQLVEQMQLAKEDQTYAKREVYLSALRKARFLVPLEWTLTKNIRHRTLSTISRPNGETFLVAFTGWNELFKWREDEEERVVALSHEELCSQVMASDSTYDGFVIDPYGVNLITYKQELIAAQPLAIPQTTRSTGREATIGTPRIFSQRMMNAIRHTLERYYVVRCAYFLLMEAEDGERNYILVLDFIGDCSTASVRQPSRSSKKANVSPSSAPNRHSAAWSRADKSRSTRARTSPSCVHGSPANSSAS